MIKLCSIIKRRPGMSVEAFQTHWRTRHAPLVSSLPGLRRYVQSHTLLSGYRKHEPAADGLAELWFDDTSALRALHGTPELAAVEADEQVFVDDAGHLRLFVDEHVIKDGPTPPEGMKNIEFVKRRPDLSIEAFQHHWREVHGPLGASIAPIRRYVQNHARSTSYRAGRQPALDGLALTWFDDTAAMRDSATTPEYAETRADEDNFVDHPLAFIITREHVIRA